jgi:magnesium transporter
MQKTFKIVESKIVSTEDKEGQIFVFVNPDDVEKKKLVDELNIDEHTLSSSLDADELSRLEFEPNHIAFIFKFPKNYSAKEQHLLFKVSSTGLFLFKDKIIIITSEDIPLFNTKHFNKILSLNDLMLKLIYSSIFHFLEHLKIINLISDEIEQKINKAMENKYLINQFTLGKSLVFYQNAINSNGALLEKMKINSAKINLNTEEQELLDDITVENNQCYKQAEIYSNILASLMDARASLISNNLNVLMKTLNIITIAIMVPTFVVSAFSMNVSIPLAKHPLAFFIIMGFAMISVIGFLTFWKFKKW